MFFSSMTTKIGQQLKKAREGKNLTIQKVVQVTRIRASQIEALETGNMDVFPSQVQARAFLKLYAEFLGIQMDDLVTPRGKNSHGQEQPKANDAPGNEKIPPGQTLEFTTEGSDQASNPSIKKKTLRVPWFVIKKKEQPQGSHTGDIEDGKKEPPGQSGRKPEAVPPETIASHPASIRTRKKTIPPNREPLNESTARQETANPISVSQGIFQRIGDTLRERREIVSLSVEEIEKHIHIRSHYLQAMETGAFDQLPSSVQVRGMLSNYAHYLDLDVDELLVSFAEGLQARLREQQALEEKKEMSRKTGMTGSFLGLSLPVILRRYVSIDFFVGGGLVILLLAFAIWGTSRILSQRSSYTPQPSVPPIANILASTEISITETSPSILPETTTGIGIIPPNLTPITTLAFHGSGQVQVVVIAHDQAFLRVMVDGKVEFNERVSAGNAYSFDGNNQIEILTGNGAAVSILYKQNDLGPMGTMGQVVNRIYTVDSILNPTPTFTPTPTITQTPTITLRPTNTLRPSSTPRPSATPR